MKRIWMRRVNTTLSAIVVLLAVGAAQSHLQKAKAGPNDPGAVPLRGCEQVITVTNTCNAPYTSVWRNPATICNTGPQGCCEYEKWSKFCHLDGNEEEGTAEVNIRAGYRAHLVGEYPNLVCPGAGASSICQDA